VAAKAEAFRVCPKCGTRNKGKWEFCVRCGESLQNVTIASSQPERPGKAKAAIKIEGPRPESSPVGAALLSIAFLGALVGSFYWFRGTGAPAQVATSAVLVAPKAPSPTPAPSTVPGGSDELVARARLKLAGNDVAGALPLLEEAASKDSGNASVHALYAWALVLSGTLDKGISEYTQATRIDPGNGSYRGSLAAALKLAGRTDEALQEYGRISPQQIGADTEEDYGMLLLSAKHDAAGALPHLKRASESNPDNLAFTEQYAYAMEQSRDLEGARRGYEKVLQRNPGAAESRGRLAEILISLGKNDDAITLTKTGIQLDATVPILHRDLGSLLERSGRPAEASVAYREYTRLAPNAPDAAAIKERADALAQGGGSSP
jgi:tetratricopeptide (TPR) repeat protein